MDGLHLGSVCALLVQDIGREPCIWIDGANGRINRQALPVEFRVDPNELGEHRVQHVAHRGGQPLHDLIAGPSLVIHLPLDDVRFVDKALHPKFDLPFGVVIGTPDLILV